MSRELLCILCGQHYNLTDLGTLKCRFHPGRIIESFPTSYYECCKSGNIKDRKNYGCTKVDHVSNLEELYTIVEQPYIVVPCNNTLNLKVLNPKYNLSRRISVLKEKSYILNDPYIIPIIDPNQLTKSMEYIYYKDIVMDINLNDLYKKSKTDIIYLGNYGNKKKVLGYYIPKNDDDDEEEQDEEEEVQNGNLYEYDFETNNTNPSLDKNINSNNFKPFYIIRRMDIRPKL
jgi:hypothetical protein